jgi:adenosylhomocysteine nucleosidase
MRVLVTFAVDAEFTSWRKRRDFRCISKTPIELHEAQLGRHTVRVLLTGIGWECARRATHTAMTDMFDACISSGLAGGLKASYGASDVLLFREVGEVGGERNIKSSPWLLEESAKGGALIAAKLLTSKKLVVTADEKSRMGLFGDAVDMESFRVMAGAQGRGIPAVALRAISDTAGEDLPMDFTKYVSNDGQVRLASVIGRVVSSPRLIPAMIRFGARTRGVAEKLNEYLDSLILGLNADAPALTEKVAAS